jgi:RNA polymerase sigma factor (sigma-70 family)
VTEDDQARTGGSRPAVPNLPPGPALTNQARNLEFSMFYREHMPKLVAFLMVQGVPASLAADIAQETMIETWRRWEDIERPAAYIRVTASRRWWHSARDERREISVQDPPEPTRLISDDYAAEVENRHALLQALKQLSARQRETMAWVYDGFRPTEIALILGEEPATIRSRLREARIVLRGRGLEE